MNKYSIEYWIPAIEGRVIPLPSDLRWAIREGLVTREAACRRYAATLAMAGGGTMPHAQFCSVREAYRMKSRMRRCARNWEKKSGRWATHFAEELFSWRYAGL